MREVDSVLAQLVLLMMTFALVAMGCEGSSSGGSGDETGETEIGGSDETGSGEGTGEETGASGAEDGDCCSEDAECASNFCVGGACHAAPIAGTCWEDSNCFGGDACVGASTCSCDTPCAETVPGTCSPSDTGEETAEETSDEAGEETGEEAGEETGEEDLFSFFVTSLEGMQTLSGSLDGFGGDLGGLDGADTICQQLAATVDGGNKTWRAFLSATEGADGSPVHAIDRIGDGPWYDRNGRLVAENKEGLLNERPDGDPQINEDLPNELGQGQKQFGDNHDTLTGSNMQGMLNSTDPAGTCNDWTSAIGPGTEKKVMGGHSWPREDNGGPGGGGGGPGSNGNVPPPWTEACQGLSEGDACSVTKGPKKFESTCTEVEGSSSGALACQPPGGTGGGDADAVHWISAHTVPGCAAGIQLEQVGGGQDTDVVGGGGGYGGIYCFALTP